LTDWWWANPSPAREAQGLDHTRLHWWTFLPGWTLTRLAPFWLGEPAKAAGLDTLLGSGEYSLSVGAPGIFPITQHTIYHQTCSKNNFVNKKVVLLT